MKFCRFCKSEFESNLRKAVTCGKKSCQKARKREVWAEYYLKPEKQQMMKNYKKQYLARPEVKEKKRVYYREYMRVFRAKKKREKQDNEAT